MTGRIAVVGAGLAGLTAAHDLHVAGRDVVVFEASNDIGGKLASVELDGTHVHVGADAWLHRRPAFAQLVDDLGLADDIVYPHTRALPFVATSRGLRRMPRGTVIGVPHTLRSVLRSDTLSPAAKRSLVARSLLPRRGVHGDISLGEFVQRRFGRRVVSELLDPMIGGVWSASPYEVSLREASAALADRARRAGFAGSWSKPVAASQEPVFATLRSGLTALARALAKPLDVQTATRVTAVSRAGEQWTLRDADHEPLGSFDEVILAVPAPALALILRAAAPDVASLAAEQRYAHPVVVALSVDTLQLDDTTGILVPRGRGLATKAVTMLSRKWQHVAAPEGREFVRISLARAGDTQFADATDAAITAQATAELAELTGQPIAVHDVAVRRWPNGIPVYTPGHHERTVDLQRRLHRRAPGVTVIGAATDGIGLPHIVESARAAAQAVADRTETPQRTA